MLTQIRHSQNPLHPMHLAYLYLAAESIMGLCQKDKPLDGSTWLLHSQVVVSQLIQLSLQDWGGEECRSVYISNVKPDQRVLLVFTV